MGGSTVPRAFSNNPPKAVLVNLETSEQFEFQFNPETFTESFGVNYAKHVVPGLGYQILQYIGTSNNVIPLALYLSDLAAVSAGKAPSLDMNTNEAKKFLQSLCYPVRGPSGGWAAPPLCMFVWPKVVRFTCVVTELKFTHQRFFGDTLGVMALTAELTLEEIVPLQRYSEDVRQKGSVQ
jgi:hypothetical protein